MLIFWCFYLLRFYGFFGEKKVLEGDLSLNTGNFLDFTQTKDSSSSNKKLYAECGLYMSTMW